MEDFKINPDDMEEIVPKPDVESKLKDMIQNRELSGKKVSEILSERINQIAENKVPTTLQELSEAEALLSEEIEKETTIKATKEKIESDSLSVQEEIKIPLKEIESEILAAHKDSTNIARGVLVDNPKSKALHQLLFSITGVQPGHCSEDVLNGTVISKSESVPFSIDLKQKSKHEVANELWGLLKEGNNF
ncbi:uncharacterized protein LOC100175884 [Ciona intestinalis]